MTPTGHHGTWTMVQIATDLAAVSSARRTLVSQLREARLDARVVEDAALVVHELAENAVRHGGGADHAGPVEVAWRLEGGVIDLRVKDCGTAGFAAPAWPTARLDGGRGLHIVEELCRSWDVRHGPEGTEVSARLDARTDPTGVAR